MSKKDQLKNEMLDTPRGMSLYRDGMHLIIERKWKHPIAYFLLLFFFGWNGFLAFWYYMALTAPKRGPEFWIQMLFPLIHVAAGLVLGYVVLALFKNSTKIIMSYQDIEVKTGPIPFPFPKNKTLPRSSIDQIFCVESITHGKHGPRHSYPIKVRYRDGSVQELLKGINKHEHAVWIEREIEKYLGIRDEKVDGEA
jgi:hypothetical protein